MRVCIVVTVVNMNFLFTSQVCTCSLRLILSCVFALKTESDTFGFFFFLSYKNDVHKLWIFEGNKG